MPAEYYLELAGGVTIGLTSTTELPLGEREELLLGASLPGLRITQAAHEPPAMMLHHIESDDAGMRQGEDVIELRDRWNGSLSPDLPHLLHAIARGLWLQRGLYPAHAVCIGKDDFVLLPGHSGVGKSSTALAAVSSGYKVYSGDNTLVRIDDTGILRAVGGNRPMTLRTADFQARQSGIGAKLAYGDRTVFLMEDDRYASQPEVAIGRIGLIRLTGGCEYWERLSPLSALHNLYPYFLDSERADTVVAGGRGLFKGETPAAARDRLVTGLVAVLPSLPVFKGMGDTSFVLDRLDDV